MKTRKTVKPEEMDYEFACLLNKLGFMAWDYTNKETCEKIENIKKQILDLTSVLPTLN